MAAILTEKNYINNLQNFFNDVVSTNSCYYLFAGRTTPWNNEPTPDPANTDYAVMEENIYHDIAFGKLITNNNISYLISNIPWVNNNVYAQYDPNDTNLFDENFYVVNQNYSIYKVIDNNYGANSVIQPQATPTAGTFQTSDGYTWKYMYTIPTLANTTFTSNTYVPVVPNTFVANNSVPGTIDIVRVTAGGTNYQGYHEGFITNFINQNSVKIAANAVGIDNFYTGSSIYLKAGAGANQIRPITAYNGASQTVIVNPAFDVFAGLYLGSVAGNFYLGQSVNQSVIYISFLYQSGYYNRGDLVVQSDSQASGYIGTANSSTVTINQISANNFVAKYPLIDTSSAGIPQLGLVTISNTSNVITATTANLLTYSVNNFIQVGSNANVNVRRITSITNSSIAHVDTPFLNNLIANVHSLVQFASSPVTVTPVLANGVITQTNLNSMLVQYANVSSPYISYIVGETVNEVSALNVSQNANAVVSFVNSTAMVISNINGSITSGLFLVGQSSGLMGQITNIISYPNITLANTLGNFTAGDTVTSYYANGTISGNANLLSFNYTPSGTTEYIISPTVNFVGDGNGAIAYSVVNTSVSTFPISDIVMINTGNGYTNASASISANGQYGSGASLYPVISPIDGHGANAYLELGARYGGISVTFDTATNESYYLPSYGSYRQVGIIKNPLFNSLTLNLGNPLRLDFTTQVIGANNFLVDEIVYQFTTGAAGVVTISTNTTLQLKNINGTFTSNANTSGNNMLIGLTSGATANVPFYIAASFALNSNNQTIYESNSKATAILNQVISNTKIVLTDVSGKFAANTICYDPTTYGYANVISLYTTNGTINATSTFGLKFNQTTRITLSSNNSIPFQIGEYVNQQISGASGLVLDNTHELDFIYAPNYGVMGTGIVLTDSTTGGTGIITFANSTYIRITGANGSFNSGDSISTITANGTITAKQSVLVLGDVYESIPFQVGSYYVTGSNSGAQGLIGIANTIVYPDLIRNSGQVLYINNLAPFTRSLSSKETFNIILGF